MNIYKTLHSISLGFCMKLDIHKGKKVTEMDFFIKFLIFRNLGLKVDFGPKTGFFEIYKRTLHTIFLIFCMKVDSYKGIQMIYVVCTRKFLIFRNLGLKVNFGPKIDTLSDISCYRVPIHLKFCTTMEISKA